MIGPGPGPGTPRVQEPSLVPEPQARPPWGAAEGFEPRSAEPQPPHPQDLARQPEPMVATRQPPGPGPEPDLDPDPVSGAPPPVPQLFVPPRKTWFSRVRLGRRTAPPSAIRADTGAPADAETYIDPDFEPYDFLPSSDPFGSLWHDDAARETRWAALKRASAPTDPPD